MRKYLVFIVIFVSALAFYMAWKYQIITSNATSIDSNELIFTKEEENALAEWRDKSIDNLVCDAYKGNSAAFWVLGMSYLTGSAGFPLDTKSADDCFAQSGSLGFAPSLDQVRKMYTLDIQNPFLGLVYLNLTVSKNHPELLGLYNKVRSQMITSGGLKVVNEIEKIALHKKNYISQFVDEVKKNPEGFIRIQLSKGSITDEDVLFDMNFWDNILTGRLDTGNLESWLQNPDNFCRKIERLAQGAEVNLNRLASDVSE